MADIELVIKIDEDDYRIMQHNIAVNNPLCPLSQEEMVSRVANGVPLPKGHGDLIDRSELLKTPMDIANYPSNYVMIAKAIIKADKTDG